MRIGIFGGDTAGRTIDQIVADAKQVEADGYVTYSLPQIFGLDAMGVLAVVGREVPRIALATGVVPTYSRHPRRWRNRRSPFKPRAVDASCWASVSRTRW